MADATVGDRLDEIKGRPGKRDRKGSMDKLALAFLSTLDRIMLNNTSSHWDASFRPAWAVRSLG